MADQIEEVLRHADHAPWMICRPAGYGLCEPLPWPEDVHRRVAAAFAEGRIAVVPGGSKEGTV